MLRWSRFLASFLLFLGYTVNLATAAEKRPNVLFITVDDLNDWVGVLGGHPQAKTPNIDRLARRGVLFTNAHCQAPICNPSRPCMLTSRLPSSTGLYFLSPNFRQSDVLKNAVTMPEQFAAEGYRTLGVGKIFHGGDKNFFQSYGGKFGGFGPRPKEKISYPIGHPLWDWGAFPETDAQVPDTKIATWAIEQLQKKHDKPFFLAVGFYRPHVPLFAPPKWFAMHPLDSVQLPKVIAGDRDDLTSYGKDITLGTPAPPHRWFVENKQWKHAVQSYLACVSFADSCVGRVLDALDASGQADNTIVVLCGDHGWHLGEKERWAKRSLWERSTKVPMIVSVPGLKHNVRSDQPVSLIDLYPTLIDLCRLKPNPKHEGHRLTPLLHDPQADWSHMAITTFGPHNHAVRSRYWRYIRYGDGSEELYDHRRDDNEWRNVASDPQNAKVLAEHRRHLPKVNLPPVKNVAGTGYQDYLKAQSNLRSRRKQK